MHTPYALDALNRFQVPVASLGDLDADTAGRLIAAAADMALVVDGNGVIRDVAFGNEDLRREGYGSWIGRPWIETVTVETREKVQRLLREASPEKGSPWREINHPSHRGADVPILYSVIALGEGEPVLAIGRDLRAVSALQRKLVDSQASMEREYSRVREAETRYRLLFHLSGEPVLIVGALSRRIEEANPAAVALLGIVAGEAAGRPLADLFEDSAPIREALAAARAAGRSEMPLRRLKSGGAEVAASLSLFRQGRNSHVLVRLLPDRAAPAPASSPTSLVSVIESLPDGLVVCDLDRRILAANAAFLDLVQVPTAAQVRGEPLERWLGRSPVDANVLVASLREHGAVRHFGTVIRGEYGGTEEVEVAAVAVPEGGEPCYGLSIRPVGRRLPAPFGDSGRLPESVAHLTELVGRVSMKELVRETTDLIERMCIEAALDITGDNRASAAEILGLSRQSFYSKMRRFGLGDLGGEEVEH